MSNNKMTAFLAKAESVRTYAKRLGVYAPPLGQMERLDDVDYRVSVINCVIHVMVVIVEDSKEQHLLPGANTTELRKLIKATRSCMRLGEKLLE